jgi:hypothetical protein
MVDEGELLQERPGIGYARKCRANPRGASEQP